MTTKTRHASNYANQLLSDLGETVRVNGLFEHPAIVWKRSGLLRTTGYMLPLPLASHADGALIALRALSKAANNLPVSGALLMGERARLRDTVCQGRYCAGGYGQILDAKDGRVALNLVREDDWGLIPAWLEDYIEDWAGIREAVLKRPVQYLIERAADIGLAVAMEQMPAKPKHWFSVKRFETSTPKPSPLIVDLSALWAGPLASSLLQMTGSSVVKVEGPNRPDGMRFGHVGFYALLNAGKECVALDFHNAAERRMLKQLLDKADIVIEASRPRALPQLGIQAEEFMERSPGKIWLRLTAYGQDENRIGFGDDIGVSAGLSQIMRYTYGQSSFVGDAIADPVSGIHVALAIQSCINQGGGALIDISMLDVLRYAIGDMPHKLKDVANIWQEIAAYNIRQYQMREVEGVVRQLGADNYLLSK